MIGINNRGTQFGCCWVVEDKDLTLAQSLGTGTSSSRASVTMDAWNWPSSLAGRYSCV